MWQIPGQLVPVAELLLPGCLLPDLYTLVLPGLYTQQEPVAELLLTGCLLPGLYTLVHRACRVSVRHMAPSAPWLATRAQHRLAAKESKHAPAHVQLTANTTAPTIQTDCQLQCSSPHTTAAHSTCYWRGSGRHQCQPVCSRIDAANETETQPPSNPTAQHIYKYMCSNHQHHTTQSAQASTGKSSACDWCRVSKNHKHILADISQHAPS